jgi:hypothetical protein
MSGVGPGSGLERPKPGRLVGFGGAEAQPTQASRDATAYMGLLERQLPTQRPRHGGR